MKTTVKIFVIACLMLLMACSKTDPLFDNGSMTAEKSASDKYSTGTKYQLEGFSLYKTFTVKGGIVLQDVAYENTGEIEFLGNRKFRFTFQETRPDGNSATYEGKISASGEIYFQFPSPLFYMPDGTPFYIIDVIKSHGCVTEVWGPGVNEGTLLFKGRFDGTRLTAESKFMASVIDNCPDLFSFEGDVHWIFAYDMTVAGDAVLCTRPSSDKCRNSSECPEVHEQRECKPCN